MDAEESLIAASRSAGDALLDLADEIPEAWKRSYDIISTRDHRLGSTIRREDMVVQLAIGGDLKKRAEVALAHGQQIATEFRSLLKKCNDYALAEHQNQEGLLKDPLFLDYCAVQAAARRQPTIIATKTTGLALKFGIELLERHDSGILITGPAGYGKTTFCKCSVLRDADESAGTETPILPIYIPLHELGSLEKADNEESFESLFLRDLKLQEYVLEKAKHGDSLHIRLYLDGLDEIPNAERRQKVLELAQSGRRLDPKLQIIVTSRDYVLGRYLRKWPPLQLSLFDNEQISDLAGKWLTPKERQHFLDNLKIQRALNELMRIPLLANLVLAIYREGYKLPENREHLYGMFIDLLCGGWDKAKDVKRGARYQPNVKVTVLTALAGLLHRERKRDFDEEDLRNAIFETATGLLSKSAEVLNELIQDGLVVRIGVRCLFAHHSFQEYLAAKDLNDPSGKRQFATLKAFLLGDEWWQEVLVFYIAIAGTPRQLEHWIRETAGSIGGHESWQLRYEIGARTELLLRRLRETYPEFATQT